MNVKSHSRLFGWKRKVACSSMHKDHALSRQNKRSERSALYRSDDVAATGGAGGAEQPFLAAALDVHGDGLFAQR